MFDIDEREKIYYDMIVYSFKFLDFIPAIEVQSKIDYNLSFKGLEWKYQFSSSNSDFILSVFAKFNIVAFSSLLALHRVRKLLKSIF